MATSSTGDLLGAASLALGALAIFYSLWSPDLLGAINLKKKPHFDSRGDDIEQVKRVLRTQGWPILVAAVLIGSLLAPPVFGILRDTFVELWKKHLQALPSYDAVSALLVAVWALLLLLVWLSLSTVFKLRKKRSELEQKE